MKQLVESQWNTLVERLNESGTIEGSLAIIDLNSSMGFPVKDDWYKLRPKSRTPVSPVLPGESRALCLVSR
jgi:hypothetical protein